MSTKIYNAFKIKSSISMESLSDLFSQARNDICEVICLDLAKRISEAYYYAMDKASLAGNRFKPTSEPTIADQIDIIDKRLRDGSDLLRLLVNNTCQIIPHKGSLYALTFVGTPEASKALHKKMKDFGFESYSYWNNEEKPEDVGEAEWLERKNIWDEIFEESSIPADHGFSKVFTTAETCIQMLYRISEERDRFIKAPPMEIRLRNLFDDVLDERAHALRTEDPKSGPFSALRRVRDYFEKDEVGIAEKKVILERFKVAIKSADASISRQRFSPKP